MTALDKRDPVADEQLRLSAGGIGKQELGRDPGTPNMITPAEWPGPSDRNDNLV